MCITDTVCNLQLALKHNRKGREWNVNLEKRNHFKMFQPEASFRSATEQHREATSEEVKIDTHSLVGGGVIIDSRNQKKKWNFFLVDPHTRHQRTKWSWNLYFANINPVGYLWQRDYYLIHLVYTMYIIHLVYQSIRLRTQCVYYTPCVTHGKWFVVFFEKYQCWN